MLVFVLMFVCRYMNNKKRMIMQMEEGKKTCFIPKLERKSMNSNEYVNLFSIYLNAEYFLQDILIVYSENTTLLSTAHKLIFFVSHCFMFYLKYKQIFSIIAFCVL